MYDMKKMLGKKDKNADPMKKEAKMSALKELKSMASGMLGDGIKGGLSKVTIAAKDPSSLKEGLEKAKEMLPDFESDEAKESEESGEMEESSEGSSADEMVESCETPEEIDELMKKLAEKKKELLLK